jgi:hypothetical protein
MTGTKFRGRTSEQMKIQTILDQIDLGSMALPEFQRGFVWNRDQVRALMHSMYHRHPIGTLLVWLTRTEGANVRGEGELTTGTIELLLDGQQRITSLYGIIRGKPPKFFDGDKSKFLGLYFNLESEVFEFYAPAKMKDNPLWIDVTDLMKTGVGEFVAQLMNNQATAEHVKKYINSLNAIDGIKNVDIHIDQVTGEDKTVDVVVDIFNRVNSGGTKLSKGDLSLAKICASWPDARIKMKEKLAKWKRAGFNFKMEWLLRCVTAVIKKEAYFSSLENIDIIAFKDGLQKTEKYIDALLNVISSRLGLDHERVLGSVYSFPLMTALLDQRGGKISNHTERDKILYWYINTFLWGRYSGSTESVLTKDLTILRESNDQLDDLIGLLRQDRGNLKLTEKDFAGWSRGARFYPLLYMLTRVYGARDWETGIELRNYLLGHLSSLQVHHIFPRKLLYDYGYKKSQVNALANFTFLTQETNLIVTKRSPSEYLEEYVKKHPGSVESHWIPMDRELWKVENYEAFLEARRKLIADASNEFLNKLLQGTVPEQEVRTPEIDFDKLRVPVSVKTSDEEELILDCNVWVEEQGLPVGEFMYELIDPDTEQPLAVLDLAWPAGLQENLSEPVALLIDEEEDTLAITSKMGFRCFTDTESLKNYIKTDILAEPEKS